MPKAAVKRSACDRCRAKRVRCPRAENSTAPCPRCLRDGAPCATGSPGVPGRPRKSHLVQDGSLPSGPAAESGNESSPGRSSLLQDTGDTEVQHTLAVNVHPFPADFPTPFLGTHDTNFFDFTSTAGDSSAVNRFSPGSFLLPGPLSTPPQPQGLLGAAGSRDMMYLANSFDQMQHVDPFLNPFPCLSNTIPVPRPSVASSLRDFGDKLEQRASAANTFLSDPRNMVEKCPEVGAFEGMATENPVAVLLTSTNELVRIIQSLTTRNDSHAALGDSQILLPGSSSQTASPISTETTLLILSNYLTLMRLYNSTFHHAHQSLSQLPPDSIHSLKAKAVFRIGGIASLQDLPAKLYAKSIFNVIQSHIKNLEDCLGLPPAYCLSGEATSSQQSLKGLFADRDRRRLLQNVMTQDDLQLKKEHNSFVDLVRESMKKIEALFGD
ncbi:hypothetical protein PG993_002303 [Apiospora rasikravindrae]|uniref:Zn(2)-C6 fungal-type domain-containing protein n=1 Tax=Apiospora rasikravindrae TaxID=990691 RepID=A0ABR1TWJ2_9PEZI